MILHTLHTAPRHPAFSDLLGILSPDDAVLLLGDGVYAALNDTPAYRHLSASGADLYVLRDDADAAGITDRLDNDRLITIDKFVLLTEQYTQQMAWY